jgi:RNA polymerase sigma-70 factor (ECF subfamily)
MVMTSDPLERRRSASSLTKQASLRDEEVVERVIAGDTALFEILMRRYNQRLFRVARGIVHADADAEDAVQQAWVSAYTNLAQFGGAAAFSTWLTRIVINQSLARTRKRRRLAEVDIEEQHDVTPFKAQTATPEEQVHRRETGAILEAAIDKLPEGYRLVFMMREVEQLSVAETAECLELSEDNVKVRLHRAKAMLRNSLYKEMEQASGEAFRFLGARCARLIETVLTRISTLPKPRAR